MLHVKKTWLIKKRKNIRISRLGVLNINQLRQPSNERFKLVSCSNLIKVKRIDLILESLSFIKNRKIDWFVIGDGPMRKYIEENEKRLDSDINIKMVGRLQNKEVYDFYKKENPDLFINLSSSEGVPVSIMEAMSFGIPVIATDVGGTREIVNMKNGILLESNPSPKNIAQQICNFMSLTKKEVEEKRDLAFSDLTTKYNANKNYKDFINQIINL